MGGNPRSSAELSDQDRERIRLAHHRLRKASQECEGLLATVPLRGRWDPEPAPPGAVEAAIVELLEAYRAVGRVHAEVLGLEPPPGTEADGAREGP